MLKMWKDDGRNYIHPDNAIEITLEEMLNEIDNFPKGEGYFIGLINNNDEIIHFFRLGEDEESWGIDVPVQKENGDPIILGEDSLPKEKVKQIITKFYNGENWMNLCNLKEIESVTIGNKFNTDKALWETHKRVPKEIETADIKQLAEEMLSFVENKYPYLDYREKIKVFWIEKKVNVDEWFSFPIEILKKMNIVEAIVKNELERKRLDKIKKEKEELLPSLINLCVEWAEKKGFNKLTKQEVEAFLFEKDIEVEDDTKRGLYLLVNVELKTRKKHEKF